MVNKGCGGVLARSIASLARIQRVAITVQINRGIDPRQRHKAQPRRQVIGGAHNSIGTSDKRVVGSQRYKDRAIAAFGDKIQAMIKELAKERHPGVKAGRKADIGRKVRNDQPAFGAHFNASGCQRRIQDHRRSIAFHCR